MRPYDTESIFPRTRFLRRAITLAALTIFVATAAITLAAPSGAHAKPVACVTVTDSKVPAGKKQIPRATAREGKKLTGVVNLNTATEEQLQMLPGVGPAKAERIIDNRKKRGNFKRVKDLRRVKGFGYKSVKKLEPYLTVRGPTTLRAAE